MKSCKLRCEIDMTRCKTTKKRCKLTTKIHKTATKRCKITHNDGNNKKKQKLPQKNANDYEETKYDCKEAYNHYKAAYKIQQCQVGISYCTMQQSNKVTKTKKYFSSYSK